MQLLSKNYRGEKTHEAMSEVLKNCEMMVWNHDFYAMKESVVGYHVGVN